MEKVIVVSDEIEEILTELATENEHRELAQRNVDYYTQVLTDYQDELDRRNATIDRLTRELGTFVADRPVLYRPNSQREIKVGELVKPTQLVNYLGRDLNESDHEGVIDSNSVGKVKHDYGDGDFLVKWLHNDRESVLSGDNLVLA